MNFNEQFSEWKNTGTEPSESLKTSGFQGGQKPPAPIFNWFWSKVIRAITEIQTALKNLTKSDVGLGNVDNTADSAKPVSTAQATAIADAKKAGTDAQTNLNTHTGNKSNPHGVTKTQVGLGNVPNVATNDQTPTYTAASSLATLTSGEKLSVSFGKITKAITDLISHIGNKSNPHGVTKSQVGLGSVDNTADNAKPVSTAQATAIADAKKAGTDAQTNLTSHTGNTSNPHSVTKAQVGLGNVPNVATNDQAPTYTAATTLATLTSGEKLSVSMGKIMKAITDFISHKGSTSNPHSVTKAQVGLGNVDNTSDANKPISTATQTALNGKAASTHNHAASEITSGTLSIARGGTGAGSASAALYNLINGSSEVDEPAKGDYLGIHDASGATGKKVSIETLFNNLGTMGLVSGIMKQGITGATEMAGTVAADADLMLITDASASNGVRKIKLSSLLTYIKNNVSASDIGAATTSQVNAKATTVTYTATIPTTGWSTSAPYSVAVTVSGILATDNPTVDVVLSSTADTAKAQLEAWGKIGRIVTAANSITVYCYEEVPTTEIPIQIKVVR